MPAAPLEVSQKIPPQRPKTHEEKVFSQVESRLPLNEVGLFQTLVTKRLENRPEIQDQDFNYPVAEKQKDESLLRQARMKTQENTDLEKLFYARAKIFEALLSEIMQRDWFPGFFLTETSEFDDRINGVDAVLLSFANYLDNTYSFKQGRSLKKSF